MPSVNELKRLTGNDIAFIIAALLSVIGPGLLLLMLFRPEAIIQLDGFKLTLVTTSLTLPVVALNFTFLAGTHPHLTLSAQPGVPSEADRAEALINAMALTFLVFYPALATGYLAALAFKWFLLVLAGIQIAVFVVLYIVARSRKRNAFQ
jgi:hypothetical protein